MFFCSSDTEGKLKINLVTKPSYSHIKYIYDAYQVLCDI